MASGKKKQREEISTASGPLADWTIMLYIAADGNLANFAVESLKQLHHTAGGSPGSKIVVAAQFAIDAPAGQQIPRYIFDKRGTGGIGNAFDSFLNAPDNMTEQEALISFLQWAYDKPKCWAKNYALILWGHGPELLLQPPSGQQINDPCSSPQKQGLYLTPLELEEALRDGIGDNENPTIIGFDACSMSMIEVAHQIKDYTDFMVASQEEVPDLSFPYDTLLDQFRKYGGSPADLCREAVYTYVSAYEDYICDTVTGAKNVTLSALRMSRTNTVVTQLRCLADALWAARKETGLPFLLMEARENTRDFAGGLYVDLYDFCDELSALLYAKASIPQKMADAIQQACQNVIATLEEDFVNGVVLANSSADRQCHGLSLYLPYLNSDQLEQIRQPLVKGGYDTIGKGLGAVINNAAPSLLICIRRELIQDIEGNYEDLRLAQDTGWYRFIVKQWSAILTILAPERLDLRYSAQQAAVNHCKELREIKQGPPCPPLKPKLQTGKGKSKATRPKKMKNGAKQESRSSSASAETSG